VTDPANDNSDPNLANSPDLAAPESEPSSGDRPDHPIAEASDSGAELGIGADAAITTPVVKSNTLPIGEFLDRLYGTLFLPDQTFTALAEAPAVNQGAVVVAMVNSLEALRLGKGAAAIPFAIIGGLVGWAWLGLVLQQLGKVFNVNIPLQKILTLTGFASLPWLFLAPALNLPSPWRFLVALAVMGWFTLWQIKAAAKAMDTTSNKLLLLIPLAVLGGVVALVLISNLIGLLLSLSF
jgi:hypothetical protein